MKNKETILLLGNSGRSHALALHLKKRDISLISWAPTINPGIAKLADITIEEKYIKDDHKILKIASKAKYAIIGPETPLIDGIVDCLEKKDIRVFGPNAKNARIEGSKVYMRQLLHRHDILGNIDFDVATSLDELVDRLNNNYQVAVKPDGLTGGKGVKVWGSHFKDKDMVFDYAKKILDEDGIVLLEELIVGTEFSLQAIVKGDKMIFLPLVKDYKRAYENDVGPNTGSMGSCSFADHKLPYVSDDQLELAKQIMRDVILGLNEENGEYNGFLYGQFMLAKDGIKIIEFNARLGDPEAINVFGLLETPLLDILDELYDDRIPEIKLKNDASVCVYVVPDGYPEKPEEGALIDIDQSLIDNAIFASVKEKDGNFYATKSRSLAVISYAPTLEEAYKEAYSKLPRTHDNLRFRNDIGKEFLK